MGPNQSHPWSAHRKHHARDDAVGLIGQEWDRLRDPARFRLRGRLPVSVRWHASAGRCRTDRRDRPSLGRQDLRCTAFARCSRMDAVARVPVGATDGGGAWFDRGVDGAWEQADLGFPHQRELMPRRFAAPVQRVANDSILSIALARFATKGVSFLTQSACIFWIIVCATREQDSTCQNADTPGGSKSYTKDC